MSKGRLRTETTALEMARYCAAYVLKDMHHVDFHAARQKDGDWRQKAPPLPDMETWGGGAAWVAWRMALEVCICAWWCWQ